MDNNKVSKPIQDYIENLEETIVNLSEQIFDLTKENNLLCIRVERYKECIEEIELLRRN